jgi:hypothetical protein
VLLTCAGYLVASSVLILLNKFLLAKDEFAYPLMLSGSGMVFTSIGSSILVQIPALVPERQVASLPAKLQVIPLCGALAVTHDTSVACNALGPEVWC